MNSRIDQVKTLFAQPEGYLRSDFNIRIRAEVVEGFVGDKVFKSILDIGCGNGAISLPLLREDNRLTLLDLSSNILSIARSHIPPEHATRVETINQDFITTAFHFQSSNSILSLASSP